MNWRYQGIYSNIISTLHVLLNKNSNKFLPMRGYSLLITFFLMLKFPDVGKALSEEINSKYQLSKKKYDKFKFYLLILLRWVCCPDEHTLSTKQSSFSEIGKLWDDGPAGSFRLAKITMAWFKECMVSWGNQE